MATADRRPLRQRSGTWEDVLREQKRHIHCHAAIASGPLKQSNARVSHFKHIPNPMLQELSAATSHSLADVIQEREEMSLKYTEVYATHVAKDRFVPGSMIFMKPEGEMESIKDIFDEFS